MKQSQIVYQDMTLKITRCLSKKGNKYRLEMTDSRFCHRIWEENFDDDEKAIESAKLRFREICR